MKIQLTESELRLVVESCVMGCLEEGKLGRWLGAAALGGALMMGNPTDANAQLNIKHQVYNRVQTLVSFGSAYGSNGKMYKGREGFYLMFSTMKDLDSEIYLPLGKNEKSALLTLQDLKSIFDNKIPYTEVSDKDGNIELSLTSGLMGQYIQGRQNMRTGILNKRDIENCIAYFNNTYDMTGNEVDELYNQFTRLRQIYLQAENEYAGTNNAQLKNIKIQQMSATKEQMKTLQQKLSDFDVVVELP